MEKKPSYIKIAEWANASRHSVSRWFSGRGIEMEQAIMLIYDHFQEEKRYGI